MLSFYTALCLSALAMPHEEKSFLAWMRETNNLFTGDEYQARFGVWMTNNRLVREHNAANGGFRMEMNHLAHLTPAEYSSLLGFRPNLARQAALPSNYVANDAIDWREKGVVNPVQDQGSCGSCWAFSTIQAQESCYAKAKGKLQKLSESNLVDCVTTCYGCNGGLMTLALDYVVKSQDGKFMLAADYPYAPRQGTCKFDASKAVSKVSGYINVVEGSEPDLAAKISQYGPAAIAIDASHYSFQLYASGIYDEKACSPRELDHGVGCVGYGSENGVDFWIVRNSWGASWGENGYIRMIRNKRNQCGQATMALVPKII